MDFLLIIDEYKPHYVYIKVLRNLFFIEQKIKTKNTFVKVLYSVLAVKMF